MNDEVLSKSIVLIVDDNPTNLKVLFEYLTAKGFKVSISTSGEQALERIPRVAPDIILLDVLMAPGMDGFEVCRRLKADEATCDIPVVFMTALTETVDKVKGFDVGADDYITKPFQHKEVLARIKAHLTIREQQQALQRQNRRLEELLREKNEFLGIVSHDLKNPLNVIIGFNELLTIDPSKVELSTREIGKACDRMTRLISNLLDSNLLETGEMQLQMESVDFCRVVSESLHLYRNQADAKEIDMIFTPYENECTIQADFDATVQVFDNLLSNAVKYSPHGTQISIRLSEIDHAVRCAIQDEGPGLSEEDQRKMFGKFARLSATPTGGEGSTGLGLSIVKKITEMMNGKVWAESDGKGKGSTFYVEFPKAL